MNATHRNDALQRAGHGARQAGVVSERELLQDAHAFDLRSPGGARA
jgi:hypothetical protein